MRSWCGCAESHPPLKRTVMVAKVHRGALYGCNVNMCNEQHRSRSVADAMCCVCCRWVCATCSCHGSWSSTLKVFGSTLKVLGSTSSYLCWFFPRLSDALSLHGVRVAPAESPLMCAATGDTHTHTACSASLTFEQMWWLHVRLSLCHTCPRQCCMGAAWVYRSCASS